MIHDFHQSLAKSERQAAEIGWLNVYRKAFPDLETAASVRGDGWAQRGGVDRVLTLSSGKVLTVDEKVREKDWGDILLEYWSDRDRKVRGWVAKDLACDFIAYAFLPSKRCYLLPFQTLRRAWRDNASDWVERHKKVEARNRGYVTVSVAVPTQELLDRIRDAMVIDYG